MTQPERAPTHSLVTVAAGSHPLYPPLEVTLLAITPVRVKVTLRHPGERRCVEWAPEAQVLDHPCMLSDGLEAMLRTLCPPPEPGRLP